MKAIGKRVLNLITTEIRALQALKTAKLSRLEDTMHSYDLLLQQEGGGW